MDKNNPRRKPVVFDKMYSHADYSNRCAHCERVMNNFAGGYSRGYNNELLCYPNAKNRPDCYELVTRYNHETPCSSPVCYEDHADFLTYVDSHKNNAKSKKH